MTKERKEPTESEIAEANEEMWVENRERYLAGADLAREAWKFFSPRGQSFPTAEQVAGVNDLLDRGVERDMVAHVVADATALAERFGARDVEDVLDVAVILVEDDRGEAHLDEAEKIARECLVPDGVLDPREVFGVYYLLADDGDEEDE